MNARTLLIALMLVLVTSFAEACPSCKAALAADGGRYVNALFWSILFMLGMPFSIVAAFGIAIYRMQKARPQALSQGEMVAR